MPTDSPLPYPHDPDAPYFETLYAVAKKFRPAITRDELLAVLRNIDPDDELRITDPQAPDQPQ